MTTPPPTPRIRIPQIPPPPEPPAPPPASISQQLAVKKKRAPRARPPTRVCTRCEVEKDYYEDFYASHGKCRSCEKAIRLGISLEDQLAAAAPLLHKQKKALEAKIPELEEKAALTAEKIEQAVRIEKERLEMLNTSLTTINTKLETLSSERTELEIKLQTQLRLDEEKGSFYSKNATRLQEQLDAKDAKLAELEKKLNEKDNDIVKSQRRLKRIEEGLEIERRLSDDSHTRHRRKSGR